MIDFEEKIKEVQGYLNEAKTELGTWKQMLHEASNPGDPIKNTVNGLFSQWIRSAYQKTKSMEIGLECMSMLASCTIFEFLHTKILEGTEQVAKYELWLIELETGYSKNPQWT